MQRRARDDFEALLVAQGMENGGAKVVSIVAHDRTWYVWARVESDEQMSVVDDKINQELGIEDDE